MKDRLQILCGDVTDKLRELPAESVHCCITSPPYWGLRDYGTAQWEGGDDGCDHREYLSPSRKDPVERYSAGGAFVFDSPEGRQYATTCGKCGARRIDSQLGLEKTPEEWVAKMVAVFREVRRVLRKDGTLWLNLGDSYNANQGAGFDTKQDGGERKRLASSPRIKWGKPKDLCGIPWRLAFALQADGWWLRSDIIWHKPNPMPESCTDRPTKSHEYLFLLTKSASYYYDAEAIREPHQDINHPVLNGEFINPRAAGGATSADFQPRIKDGIARESQSMPTAYRNSAGRNKRSVWTVATAPYPEAHFATYPPDLIKPCILAGTSAKGCCAKCGAPWERVVERGDGEAYTKPFREDGRPDDKERAGRNFRKIGGGQKEWDSYTPPETLGWIETCKCCKSCDKAGVWEAEHIAHRFEAIPCTVLDPFAGSGTTGAVALELGRKAILIELNPKYVELINRRCDVTPGLALA